MTYINWKPNGNNWQLETVDQFESRAEATKMLHEYQLAFNDFRNLYLSNRCTEEWRAEAGTKTTRIRRN